MTAPSVAADAAMSEPTSLHNNMDTTGQSVEILPDHYWGGESGTIPVFKPTMDQFRSFPDFIKKIDHYGMKTGIVKVIPPQEWLDSLPDLDDKVKDIRVQSAIEQNFAGSGGAFRQMNLEKHRSYSLPQWRKICDSSEHQPPAKRGEARRGGGRKVQQANRVIEPPATPPPTTDSGSSSPEPGERNAMEQGKERHKRTNARNQEDLHDGFNYRIDDNDQYTPERCQDLERSYWKSLTFNQPMYGADLPGSLFDDDIKDWNVAHLDNILNRLGVVLPGVNSAYLYLGMWKATFSWHVEDMDLYSINYIHFGAPKQWYSVSQEDNQKFERVMKDIFPNDARHCNQFMRHKTFGASPARLAQHDLHVNKLVHYEKEFVITFPYGYHSGYNLGYNCAESVNFATEEWLEYGKVARKCECVTDAVSIDVNDIIKAVNGHDTLLSDMQDVLTPPPSDDEAATSSQRVTYSEFDRLRRTNKKKRNKDAMYEKAPIVQYKKLSDRYHSTSKNSPGTSMKPVIKKIKLTLPKAPCELCPKAPKHEDLIDAGSRRRVHRICADFLPETSIVKSDDGKKEEVVGLDKIDKARKALKCALCKVAAGACFQCSSPKCVRAFHGSCAYDAGVLVQRMDTSESAQPSYHFLCKTHRPRRPAPELLEFDGHITQFAASLQDGATAQAQFASGHCFSGLVRENRRLERTIVIEVGNEADIIEVDYQWILPAPKRLLPCMKTLMLEQQTDPENVAPVDGKKPAQRTELNECSAGTPQIHKTPHLHAALPSSSSSSSSVQPPTVPAVTQSLVQPQQPSNRTQYISPYTVAQSNADRFGLYRATVPYHSVLAQGTNNGQLNYTTSAASYPMQLPYQGVSIQRPSAASYVPAMAQYTHTASIAPITTAPPPIASASPIPSTF